MYGTPAIINTDQGSQYTTPDWVETVESMAYMSGRRGGGFQILECFGYN